MKKKILIIEDEELISKNLNRLLNLEGFDSHIAENGIEGIQKSEEILPDLILCDIMMPKLDGYNVLHELKQNPRTNQIPFIFLSAKSDKISIRQGMEKGADDYLVKPVKSKDLLSIIQLNLNKKEEQKKHIDDTIDNFQDNFFKNINHEFYTPLNGILGLGSILDQKYDNLEKDQFKSLIGGILESGERLYHTLKRLVTYAKLNMYKVHQMEQREKRLIPKEILVNRIELIAQRFDRLQDLNYQIKCGSLVINEEDLLTIMDELVNNAFKFTQAGDRISINSYTADEKFIISVHNENSYLSNAEISQIAPFVQFNKKKFAQDGVGLGLCITKLIAEIYGGKLKVMSSKQQGTEILVTINNQE